MGHLISRVASVPLDQLLAEVLGFSLGRRRIAYCMEGIADAAAPWRVGELAAVAQLSTSQLERLCRRTLGMAPRGVLQRLRIENAVRLLATTTLTAGEIAAACGFYDQSSFTRQFRSVLGLTPGAFRALG